MSKLPHLWRQVGRGEHWPSGSRAGGQGLLARPEVFRTTSVIIPAIAVQFYTVLVSVVVGFPFFPEAELQGRVVHPFPGTLVVVVTEADPGALVISRIPRLQKFLLLSTVDDHQLGPQVLTRGDGIFPDVLGLGEEVAASLEEFPFPGTGAAEASQGDIHPGQLLEDLLQV